MNCEEAINLMDGYMDGELDPITNQEIERHLRDCRACEQAYAAQRALVRTIAGGAVPYYKAPAELRQRIQSSLRDGIADKPTVKPWLDAKLDFAPAVVDLASEGFPLLGGRLDYLDNRTVAALVYQRRKHFINVFTWPAESGTTGTTKTMTRQGYQLLHWVDSDINYWAVSDVSEADLQAFKKVFEDRTARH